MTFEIPWKSAYADKNSDEYKKFVAEIQVLLLEAFKSMGVSGVQVLSLESGSVIVKFVLGFNNGSVDISAINAAINAAISNGDLSSLNATGTVTVAGK